MKTPLSSFFVARKQCLTSKWGPVTGRCGVVSRMAFVLLACHMPLTIPGLAQRLEYAGVTGNSGEDGKTLIRTSVGRSGGGVVVDGQGRIFTGGGNRILVLDATGKLLWHVEMPEEDWVLGGPFAVGGKHLYFTAGPPVRYEGEMCHLHTPWSLIEPNVCRVEMAPGAQTEILVTRKDIPLDPTVTRPVMTLASSPRSDKVYLGYTTASGGPESYSVFEVLLKGLKPVFAKPIHHGGLAVDEEGCFYLGGDRVIQRVDSNGESTPGFTPVTLPSIVDSSFFVGAVMLTRNAIWDMGLYGLLGRFTRKYEPNPGIVSRFKHELCYVAQIADAPDSAYYIKSSDTLYVARIKDDALQMINRFGALPRASALAISESGYIGVGNDTAAGMLWFDFENNRPSAPPVKTQFPGPIGQVFRDDEFDVQGYGLSPSHLVFEHHPRPKEIALYGFRAEPFVEGANLSKAIATGEWDHYAACVAAVKDFVFVIDGDNHQLFRATRSEACQFVKVDAVPAKPEERLTSISIFAGRNLLLAANGTIHALDVRDDGSLKPMWQFSSWEDRPETRFGKELYLSTSANLMLVTDTQRHRILLFGFGEKVDQPPIFKSQMGETDQAGSDRTHLSSPTLVSISGMKAVAYDSSNQRLVKIRVK